MRSKNLTGRWPVPTAKAAPYVRGARSCFHASGPGGTIIRPWEHLTYTNVDITFHYLFCFVVHVRRINRASSQLLGAYKYSVSYHTEICLPEAEIRPAVQLRGVQWPMDQTTPKRNILPIKQKFAKRKSVCIAFSFFFGFNFESFLCNTEFTGVPQAINWDLSG